MYGDPSWYKKAYEKSLVRSMLKAVKESQEEHTMIGFERYCLSDKATRTVDGENLTFSGHTMSAKPFSITVKLSAANEWINGGYMQQCFPHLTSEQREILLSGNDDESWADMFPPESISTVVEEEE